MSTRPRRRNAASPTPTMQGYHAGFISRLLAFTIDILIISAITLTITAISSIVIEFFGFTWLSQPIDSGMDNWQIFTKIAFLAGLGLLNFSIFVGYHIIFLVLTGQTLGKRFIGLRVVGIDEDRLNLKQAVKRYLGYWVSGAPLFAGYFWVVIDDQRQTWHDKFAKTYVIYHWDARHNQAAIEALQERGKHRAENYGLVRKRLRKRNKKSQK